MLRNKFLSICNSHRILAAMMMTIESGKDILVLFFYISKCNWLVLVLTSRIALLQRVLSYFRVLLSLHSPQKGKQYTEWVLLRFSGAERFQWGKDKRYTMWNAHPNSQHCRAQGERKESWKEWRFFRISSESQYRVSNQCELARVRNLFRSLALKLGNPETKTQGGAGFVIPMNKS